MWEKTVCKIPSNNVGLITQGLRERDGGTTSGYTSYSMLAPVRGYVIVYASPKGVEESLLKTRLTDVRSNLWDLVNQALMKDSIEV